MECPRITQEEAKIIGLDFSSSDDVENIENELENWNYSEVIPFKNIYNVCVESRPQFSGLKQKVEFLQFLRQLRLAREKWQAMRDKAPSKTRLYDTLSKDEKAGTGTFPDKLGISDRINQWQGMSAPLPGQSGNNGAFNSIYFKFYDFIYND